MIADILGALIVAAVVTVPVLVYIEVDQWRARRRHPSNYRPGVAVEAEDYLRGRTR